MKESVMEPLPTTEEVGVIITSSNKHHQQLKEHHHQHRWELQLGTADAPQ